MGVFDNLANAAKHAGKDVMNGMRGNTKSFTKDIAKRMVKSNMTEGQVFEELGKAAARKSFKTSAAKKISKEGMAAIEKSAGNIKKLAGNAQRGNVLLNKGKLGESVGDRLIGRQLAKGNLGYQIGDFLGGGIRSTVRSAKAGHNIEDALKAGFTKKVNGERVLRGGRVAGAAMSVGMAGRVASGGGLSRDRYGRVNVPGVPFI